MPTYLGPASALTLADGTVVHPGEDCTIDAATQAALEATGHLFSDTADRMAPQQAGENLADEGTTAEQQAAASGLGVDAEPPAPPAKK
jgi:hypothetical protein